MEVTELHATRTAEASRYATLLGESPVARAAAEYLDRAATLELATAGLPETQVGILHHYFMALEGVVQAVVKGRRVEWDPATPGIRETIVTKLSATLSGGSSISEKSRAIREARDALARAFRRREGAWSQPRTR